MSFIFRSLCSSVCVRVCACVSVRVPVCVRLRARVCVCCHNYIIHLCLLMAKSMFSADFANKL